MPQRPRPQYAAPNSRGRKPQAKTSNLATVSLVLGIGSFFCSLLTGIPAIILGIMAHSKISKSRGRLQGGGLATGGIVTGTIGSVLSVVTLAILFPTMYAARDNISNALNNAKTRTSTMNSMRQICFASLNYESENGQFPSDITKQSPSGGLSWRVHILPQLGSDAARLHKRFHLDEPWDSPHNKTLISSIPTVYQHQQFQSDLPDGHTVFQMPTSDGGQFRTIHVKGRKGFKIGAITDGTSNSVIVVETNAQSAVPWTKPMDWQFDFDNPRKNLANVDSGGTIVGTVDGAVHFIDTSEVPDDVFRTLFSISGGEVNKIPNW